MGVSMKRIVLTGLLGATLVLAGCGGQSATPTDAATTDAASTDATQVANPFTDYASLAEAAEAAGFTMDVPESIGNYGYRVYQVCDAGSADAMIQVSYSASQDADTYCYIIRKAAGSNDISGDYTFYPQQRNMFLGTDETEVWAQGSDGTVNLVTWTKGDYTYSLAAYNGASMTEDEVAQIFEQIS